MKMDIFSCRLTKETLPFKAWKLIKKAGLKGCCSRYIRRDIQCHIGIPVLKFCKVNPYLYVGPRLSRLGKVLLKVQGVNCSVNMREDLDDVDIGVALKDYCYPHESDGSEIDKLEFGVAYIDRQIKAGNKVYVHCNHGLHSAPLMVAAYFISRGHSIDEAVDLIYRTQPYADIYPNRMEYLNLYAKMTWQNITNEAQTQEEKISAAWASAAHQKYLAGNYAGAVEDFKKAVQIAPNFPALYRVWAIMESYAGFYEKAESAMKKATDLDPNNLYLWLVWGNIEKHRGLLDRAYVYSKKALDISGNALYILNILAEIEKRRGNYENAIALLMKILEKKLNDYLLSAFYTSLADNLRLWANSLRIHENTISEEVLEKLNRAYTLASKAIKINHTVRALDCFRDVCLDTAIFLFRKGENKSARLYVEKSIVRNPVRVIDKKRNVLAYNEFDKDLDIFRKRALYGIPSTEL